MARPIGLAVYIVKLSALTKKVWFLPVIGAVVTVLCGLILHEISFGQKWENASYDNLYRFGGRAASNNVVLVQLDDSAYSTLGQVRGSQWDRSLHARFLEKLAADRCPLVVFDVFMNPKYPTTNDERLAAAMGKEGNVVLMEKSADPEHSGIAGAHESVTPQTNFVQAAKGMGIGEVDTSQPPRRHYPFRSPHGDKISLSWAAARVMTTLSPTPQERWLRYYSERGTWTNKLSYQLALEQPPGYFSNKVVFVGQWPSKENPGVQDDPFQTPYGDTVGGVEIHATTYLNLIRGDWLRRFSDLGEIGLLALAGIVLGGCLCLTRWPIAVGISVAVFCGILLGAVLLSYYSNYWFDWMTIAGGQLPVALSWALVVPVLRPKPSLERTLVMRRATGTAVVPGVNLPRTEAPEAPDYELCEIPFGSGAYGNVWLARNAIGQWQALKAVYLSGFGEYTAPYDREFNGISRYKPVSEKHSGLLRIDFISQKKPGGYFYYVMELGDSLTPGWEKDPGLYQPRDLSAARRLAEGNRLPTRECLRIGLALCEALEFLHNQGLTHRDIKPGNIIFVNGQPKLADVGLIAEIRPNPSEQTWVGTPAYMPPPPEPPGTAQADIYGMGMVLYVISTGRDPEFFPGLSTTLAAQVHAEQFLPLNKVILKACQPDMAQRYAATGLMRADLAEAMQALDASEKK